WRIQSRIVDEIRKQRLQRCGSLRRSWGARHHAHLRASDYPVVMGLPQACRLRLKTQLDCLPVLLAGVDHGALEKKPVPEKWSGLENMAHLARYHEMFLARLDRIRLEERPVLPRYRAEDDPEWPRWIAMPVDEVLAHLQKLRSEL